MSRRLNKLEVAAQQEQQAETRETLIEFATAEELLRYDAAQVSPPAELKERLVLALAAEPARKQWWQRLLRK